MHRYEIIIFWNNEDEAFIADVPGLPGCMAHGSSQRDALDNAQEAIEYRRGAARESGNRIPEPKGHRQLYTKNI